jgi:hypothetical protein
MTWYPYVAEEWSDNDYHHHIRHDLRGGDNTPYELRKRGIYEENSFSRSIFEEDSGNITYGTDSITISSHVLKWINFNYSSIDYPLTADLLANVYSKWKGSDFSVGVTVGEGKESLRMIADRLQSLACAALALKHGNFSQVGRCLGKMPRSARRSAQKAHASGQANSAWLELQFGWLPMINDIYEATDQILFNPLINRYRSGKSEVGYITPASSYTVADEVIRSMNEKKRFLMLVAKNEPDFLERWGLTNPAGVIWELIPYSFVIDWFLPIEDYLTSLHALSVIQGTFVDSQTFEKGFNYCIKLGRPYKPGSSVIFKDGNPLGYRREFEFSRTIKTPLSLGFDLAKDLPRAIVPKWDLNIKQVANGASLVMQRLRSLR